MPSPRNAPYTWITWITKLLAGEDQCEFSAWTRAHFWIRKRTDDSFDTAAWAAGHTAMVQARVQQLVADGWTVTVEDQNAFKLTNPTNGSIVSGKPDIIACRGRERLVIDEKSGQQRNSDWWQVLLYLYALPHIPGNPLAGPDLEVRGQVEYRDRVIDVYPHELTAERREAIKSLARRLAAHTPPAPLPSARECKFCALDSHVCPSRMDAPIAAAVAEAF